MRRPGTERPVLGAATKSVNRNLQHAIVDADSCSTKCARSPRVAAAELFVFHVVRSVCANLCPRVSSDQLDNKENVSVTAAAPVRRSSA